MSSPPSRQPTEVVTAFLAALEALDVDAARALLAPEVTYQNVPLPPVRGAAATERTLRAFLIPFTGFAVETLHLAADGEVVLTERVDTLSRGRFAMRFWVCGTFVVRGGRIVLWRDRFDFADLAAAAVRGLLSIPFRR